MEQKSCHRLVYKIDSSMLKRANWKLNLPLQTAMRTCPDVIVALNDSQCLRFIDEINGVADVNNKVRAIQNKIKKIKKKPKSRENLKLINCYYETLYGLQFQRDYISVVMNSKEDYDRANLGFSINYGLIDNKECIIHYRRFLGTNGGIKKSTIVYVNEQIYTELKRRLDNGRNPNGEFVPAKLEAYQGLICSGSIPLPSPKGVIVVKDCITHFKEDIILIDDSGDGEPKLTYEDNYEIEHNDSDGYGLMTPEYSRVVNTFLCGEDKPISGMNTRSAFTKGMLYTFDFKEFAEKIAGTFEVEDVWGDKRDIRDADVILTESMLKLWSSYDSWEDYLENCKKNNYHLSATKTTPDQLENVRDTNYQFLQSYEFSDDDLYNLCLPTIKEIKDVIGLDYRKSLTFLAGFGLDDNTAFSQNLNSYIRALMVEPKLINDPFIRKKIYHMIRKRIEMGERGAIRIKANYAMISGDPYALCQSIFNLTVTGLLKAGEVYHKYWIDRGSDEIACFRAPMTCHNNIRKMKLSRSPEAAYWYRYIDTALIYNAWDSSCEAMNGADKDGDTNMCTDDPIIVQNTKPLRTIICLQKNAKKIIPTEESIIEANKLAFNDEIGEVTNRVTSMICIADGFPKESEEYKVLQYRIMCGQLFQQNTIDRAKGIISKSMPVHWYSMRDNLIGEDDNEESKAKKIFNQKIVASRKPYFMGYVYPKLRAENNTYIKNNTLGAIRRFSEFGINDITDLISYENPTPEMKEYLDYYNKLTPVDNNKCVINRIAWLFESEFKTFMSDYSRKIRESDNCIFDYRIMKSGVEYSQLQYDKISEIYKEYQLRTKEYRKESRIKKVEKYDNIEQHMILVNFFKRECEQICPNEYELCDILLDMCYQAETSKQFVWDMCGDTILQNLLKKHDYELVYPKLVSGQGEFEYCGEQFVMQKTRIEVIDV